MGTLYTGVAGNVSLAGAAQGTVPADGDNDNAATFTPGTQKLYDYVEALRQLLSVTAFSEGFESATFPPTATREWATPSPRFPSDSSWVRSTTNPIAGTASASAPVPQALSTNSSLGLTVMVTTPSRLSVLWAVNGNANTSDHLDIIIDGVTVAQFSTQVSNTLVGSIYYSDLLSVGQHTIDFRWIRGASASVAAEECKIDTVQVIPEEMWRNDPARLYFFDEGFGSPFGSIVLPVSGQNFIGNWNFETGTNKGNSNFGQTGQPGGLGIVGSITAAVAAGDYVRVSLQGSSVSAVNPATQFAFAESRFLLGVRSANAITGVGLVTSPGGTDNNYVQWVFDGSLGATSTLRWRIDNNAVVTTLDSGIATADNTFFRLGVMCATVRGVSMAVFTKDGKALPGAASIPPVIPFGMPAVSSFYSAGFRNKSVAAGIVGAGSVDWVRLLMLRP